MSKANLENKIQLNNNNYLIFAQHGWADNNNNIKYLAKSLADQNSIVIVPNLGYLQTFISIKILIKKLEKIIITNIQKYPQTKWKIIGHSMGGLIWLEILERHPEWWNKVHSLVCIGSPVGGADLARIIDPLQVGIGIAKDLGKNRRYMAEKIAQKIPTLTISSNFAHASDGIVPVSNTYFDYAKFVTIAGVSHPDLRTAPLVKKLIKTFWQKPIISSPTESNIGLQIIKILQSIKGMTDTNTANYQKAKPLLILAQGLRLSSWTNLLGLQHIYLINQQNQCLYAGFVGLLDRPYLQPKLIAISNKFK